jgi:hypothetical protein
MEQIRERIHKQQAFSTRVSRILDGGKTVSLSGVGKNGYPCAKQ